MTTVGWKKTLNHVCTVRIRETDEIMLVSAEEVLDARGSLLHVTETEAILLQLLRQLSRHQLKGLTFRIQLPQMTTCAERPKRHLID